MQSYGIISVILFLNVAKIASCMAKNDTRVNDRLVPYYIGSLSHLNRTVGDEEISALSRPKYSGLCVPANPASHHQIQNLSLLPKVVLCSDVSYG